MLFNTTNLTDTLIDSVGGDPTARADIRGGNLPNSQWVKLPAVYKLFVRGVGSVTIDVRTTANTVTVGTTPYPAANTPYYPYFGDDAYEVRAIYTNTPLVEIV